MRDFSSRRDVDACKLVIMCETKLLINGGMAGSHMELGLDLFQTRD